MTSDFHLVLNLRTIGATHPLFHAHAWYAHRQFYFISMKIRMEFGRLDEKVR
jgi:hypothetical protein